MRDPSYEFEQKEFEREVSTKTVHAVLVLPPRQQRAMFCFLKERLDNLLPLIDIMHNQQIDLEEINWPQEKADVQRLRSLVSITRKKLHGLLDDL